MPEGTIYASTPIGIQPRANFSQAQESPSLIMSETKHVLKKETMLDMVVEAINTVGHPKKGASCQAIKKWIIGNSKMNQNRLKSSLKKALEKGVESGILQKAKGDQQSAVSLVGSFKVVKVKPSKNPTLKINKPAKTAAVVIKAPSTRKPANKPPKKLEEKKPSTNKEYSAKASNAVAGKVTKKPSAKKPAINISTPAMKHLKRPALNISKPAMKYSRKYAWNISKTAIGYSKVHLRDSSEKPTIKYFKKPAAKSSKKPAAESSKKPAAESSKKPAAESSKKPAAESSKKPAAESSEEPDTPFSKKPATKSSKKPAEKKLLKALKPAEKKINLDTFSSGEETETEIIAKTKKLEKATSKGPKIAEKLKGTKKLANPNKDVTFDLQKKRTAKELFKPRNEVERGEFSDTEVTKKPTKNRKSYSSDTEFEVSRRIETKPKRNLRAQRNVTKN